MAKTTFARRKQRIDSVRPLTIELSSAGWENLLAIQRRIAATQGSLSYKGAIELALAEFVRIHQAVK